MWLFQNDSYLSVVAHREQPGMLLVRSRIEGDIERAIPTAAVFQIQDADYRYRAIVSVEALQQAMSDAIAKIDYPNFKNSVKDNKRHDAYMGVWNVMARAFGAYGR
jgi:hypothetical protein